MDPTEFPLFTESGRFISYNYYDKKGYLFSQTTNALSLVCLHLLYLLEIYKNNNNKNNISHSLKAHSFLFSAPRGGFQQPNNVNQKKRKKADKN